MKVLIDTNILFSTLLFPGSKPAAALLHVADYHEMVLCDRNIAEIREILQRKAPKYLPDDRWQTGGNGKTGSGTDQRPSVDTKPICYNRFDDKDSLYRPVVYVSRWLPGNNTLI